ncbi:hypothetical protein WJX74_007053 [Apatococcus lobatus]|uniref:Uncharacterized protein n=1 Tax=Apatococcus lobatus TaxID=904363 RepID=A0AAW1QDR1_9CHLO
MEAGFARFLLEQNPDVYHPFGPDARAVVPAFIAEEHKNYASQQHVTLELDARKVAVWLEERGWVSDPSKARACGRPYNSRGRPYTPPFGQDVRCAWSELLRQHAQADQGAGTALDIFNSYQAALGPSAASSQPVEQSGEECKEDGASETWQEESDEGEMPLEMEQVMAFGPTPDTFADVAHQATFRDLAYLAKEMLK